MSDWTLNGAPVLSGRVVAPLLGRWVVDLEVDADDAPTAAAELRVGGVAWVGTVHRGGLDEGVWRGRIVGAAGLDTIVPARSWRGLQPARGLVVELLGDVGATLDDASAIDAALPRWSRVEGRASRALSELARAAGVRWRVSPSGPVWVGVDTWPELTLPDGVTAEPLDTDPVQGAAVYGLPGAYLLPGQTFEGRRVGGVVYELAGERDRVTVWWCDG